MVKKKICIVGAYGAGKTSLVRRFVESLFDERYHTTVGVKIDKKVVAVNGKSMAMMIWDLAGGDETELPRLSHLRDASGYILVVDGCRMWTVERARVIQEKIVEDCGIDIPFVVAVNKSDLREHWTFQDTALPPCDPSNVFYTSAKTGDLVEQMFATLAFRMLEPLPD